MPAIIVTNVNEKQRIIAVFETEHAAVRSLERFIGNPHCFYNVQPITGEQWQKLIQIFNLPNWEGFHGQARGDNK